MLLDVHIYKARSVAERDDGGVELLGVPKDAEQESALRGLRSDRPTSCPTVRFAHRNQAFDGQVGEVSSQTIGPRQVWSVTLRPADGRNNYMTGVSYNGVSAEELAEMRARLLLLGERPNAREARGDAILLSFIAGPLKELGVGGSVFAKPACGLYYLKVGDVCDDVLELRLGPIRAGKMGVRFRGRRKSRYSNGEPHEILVEGTCSLSVPERA